VLQDPVLCESSVLDICQDLFHCFLGLVCYDLRSCDVITELCGIGNGVSHSFESAFIDQVNDQFHFMDTFKVCVFRSIACFYQCLKTSFHQGCHTAAENCLLTE